MSPEVATVLFFLGVIGLFVLDRDSGGRARPSKALWLPVIWLGLASSRMMSEWVGTSELVEYADQAMEGNALDRNILAVLIILALIVVAQRSRVIMAILGTNPLI